ncbi:MAG: lipid kinase, partial [Microcystaceae cyanobacterium]
MEKRALLLINRHARRGKQGFAQAIDLLDDLGFELITVPVKSSKSPAEYIHYYADQIDLVIVGGGDGTLNTVVNSLVEHQLPLGILPLGTANDLARTLGLPLAIADACQVIAAGHSKAIDLGKVNGRYFFNVASLGLSVEITQQLTKGAKQRWGVFAYALTALRVLSQTRPFHATIRANGEELTVKTLQVAVGNGLYYGGGLAIAADATIDDECLDLYSLNVQHWWQIFYLLLHLPKGRQKLLPWVSTLKAQSIEVITRKARDINTDGEITTHTPANFTVVPQILEVFIP